MPLRISYNTMQRKSDRKVWALQVLRNGSDSTLMRARLSPIQKNPALAARLSEPFRACVGPSEVIDQPGFIAAYNLWNRDPEKYQLIARDLFDLYQPAMIARNHKVSPEVVRSIRGLYPELVQAGKLKLMANLEEASLLLSDRLINEVKALDLARVPAALSVIVEKLSLLSGGATIRTEHIESKKHVVSAEELQQMFERLNDSKE